jgi:hypothetical protein
MISFACAYSAASSVAIAAILLAPAACVLEVEADGEEVVEVEEFDDIEVSAS